MVSQRVIDDPLDPIKDDLLLALRRIQLGLDAYCENPAESAPLAVMVDVIDQIRGPLAVLEHPEAVVLLEEMRATALDQASSVAQASDPTDLRRTVERLAAYLETNLNPGSRRSDIDGLEAASAPRQARAPDAPNEATTVAADPEPDASRATPALLEILHRLQKTVAENLENAADQPESWSLLRSDLRAFGGMLFESGQSRAGCLLGRLDRIAEALAAGAAEDYGALVGGVCTEVLAGLRYGLESTGNDGAALAVVLDAVEDHLAPLDTLLDLPASTETTAATLLQEVPETTANARFSGVPGPPEAAAVPAWNPPPDLPAAWLVAERALPDANLPSRGEDRGVVEPVAITVDPTELMGLADADPEFVEVFLEEARDVLVAIREELARWRENLENHEALTVIRRGFHTLKGSGRMVGATIVGDFAWEFENLLNQILSGSLTPSLTITDAVAAAVAALAPLVGETPLRGGELEALPELVARARALKRDSPKYTASAPAATAARRASMSPAGASTSGR